MSNEVKKGSYKKLIIGVIVVAVILAVLFIPMIPTSKLTMYPSLMKETALM